MHDKNWSWWNEEEKKHTQEHNQSHGIFEIEFITLISHMNHIIDHVENFVAGWNVRKEYERD